MTNLQPWLALGVLISTAATDAVYVMFNAAVSSRRRIPAATWSSVWYLLSAFAVTATPGTGSMSPSPPQALGSAPTSP